MEKVLPGAETHGAAHALFLWRGCEGLEAELVAFIWVFPIIGVGPQNGWFILEKPIKMDDLGGKTPIFGNIHLFIFLEVGSLCHTTFEQVLGVQWFGDVRVCVLSHSAIQVGRNVEKGHLLHVVGRLEA